MTKDDLNCPSVPALLYALGRDKHGLVVDTVVRTLIRNVKDIQSDIRYRMQEHVAYALNSDEGNSIDHQLWNIFLKEFSDFIE